MQKEKRLASGTLGRGKENGMEKPSALEIAFCTQILSMNRENHAKLNMTMTRRPKWQRACLATFLHA